MKKRRARIAELQRLQTEATLIVEPGPLPPE
jgi:hypothetical protein